VRGRVMRQGKDNFTSCFSPVLAPCHDDWLVWLVDCGTLQDCVTEDEDYQDQDVCDEKISLYLSG
jgi:hypothetical protein